MAAPEEKKITVGLIATVVICGGLVALIVTQFVAAAGGRAETEVDLETVAELKAGHIEAMGKGKELNKAKGKYKIPVSKAEKIVLAEIQADPNAASPPAPEKEDLDAGADGGDAGDAGDDAGEAGAAAADAGAPAPAEAGAPKKAPAPAPAPKPPAPAPAPAPAP